MRNDCPIGGLQSTADRQRDDGKCVATFRRHIHKIDLNQSTRNPPGQMFSEISLLTGLSCLDQQSHIPSLNR
jgi:hypothetical protein